MDKPYALIVEDDRDIVALFRHVLDVAGYHTEIVLNGKEAMERLLSNPPDIVLLDLQLPGMSGVEILQKMRADERLSSVPVVVITAYSYYTDSLPVEPDLLLLKPVDINQLSDLVQRLRTTHGALREPSRDKITRLYTLPFFTVRLTFALERIRQANFLRFGVLIADLEPFEQIKARLNNDDFNTFMRKKAEQFKGTLRPTDTIAWSDDGYFLSLIEEVSNLNIPLSIAKRVRDGFAHFLENDDTGIKLRMNLGVVICDEEYNDVDQILEDVKFARALLRKESSDKPGIYDREMIRAWRNT